MGLARLVISSLVLVAPAALAGQWSLRLGDIDLEGISVDGSLAGDSFHLGLASDTAWFTFSFPAPGGQRPERALAERVNLNAFEPNILCQAVGPAGLLLDGDSLSGEVECTSPGGTVRLEGSFVE
jgi:hypothetical protein